MKTNVSIGVIGVILAWTIDTLFPYSDLVGFLAFFVGVWSLLILIYGILSIWETTD